MYFDETSLLTPPLRRAAYSDRTAWLLAEMSRLAYFRFEGTMDVEAFAKVLAGVTDHSEIQKQLIKYMTEKSQLASDAEVELNDYLDRAKFRCVKVFNKGSLQAFIVARDSDKVAVLAFRGTEATKWEDIKVDLKAATIEVGECRVHEGFYNSLQSIKTELQTEINDLVVQDYSFFITGHSLGGGLALMATKYIVPNSPGACYTFGGPRVGSSKFADDIKTPIYRLVNAADIVPRVPPAFITPLLIWILKVVRIPLIGEWLIEKLERLAGYRHQGDMRYLSACKADFSDLRLIANPTIIDRGIRFFTRWSTNWKAPVSDHGVQHYCDKLAAFAKKRANL